VFYTVIPDDGPRGQKHVVTACVDGFMSFTVCKNKTQQDVHIKGYYD
jgi:hypothetical protein